MDLDIQLDPYIWIWILKYPNYFFTKSGYGFKIQSTYLDSDWIWIGYL